MSSDVYIFGYQSILATGSLATSIFTGCSEHQLVPARLQGYIRCWNAVRDFVTNATKRYVHAKDWRIAEHVAFANLKPHHGTVVNGVCRRIPSDGLVDLDFREQGYVRLEVSEKISPYDGYKLDRSIPCFAYVDPLPDTRAVMVSQSYYDMGRVGAASISRFVPEFLNDYLASTELPTIIANDLVFVFFSGDGHHLWLLEESDSSLVLLHRFTLPQLTPFTHNPPELLRGVSSGLEWLDARHRTRHQASSNRRVPLGMVRDLLLAASGKDVSSSPYWLCRLAAADSSVTSTTRLDKLAEDADFWVRRAVQRRRTAIVIG
jgi:hypothetical protein